MRAESSYVMFEIVPERTGVGPEMTPAALNLTTMQRRIAELRADGYSVANIAHILGRSERGSFFSVRTLGPLKGARSSRVGPSEPLEG